MLAVAQVIEPLHLFCARGSWCPHAAACRQPLLVVGPNTGLFSPILAFFCGCFRSGYFWHHTCSEREFWALKAWIFHSTLHHRFAMPSGTETLCNKLDALEKKVTQSRRSGFKEQQKLAKLYSDLGTVLYKEHVLQEERTVLDGTTPQYPPKKLALHCKRVNSRKLFLRETQKLAKKRWDLACCVAKEDYLLQESVEMAASEE